VLARLLNEVSRENFSFGASDASGASELKVMALFEGKTPAERNKMIAAIVLPLLALIFVVRMLFGSSGPSTANTNTNTKGRQRQNIQQRQSQQQPTTADAAVEDLPKLTKKIDCCPSFYGGAEAGRNIFAFYVKPTQPPPGTVSMPVATPTPPPPVPLVSITPQSVFARTASFTLQASGDKFGPATRIYLDGQELPTKYVSMQQLTASVPAAIIASPGLHTIKVQTPDGKLYSNEMQLNVMQPPQPTYVYVGFLKRARFNTAVVKDSKGELYSVRDGDLIEGRFRVTEISERGIEVVDKDLNIKHTMPYVAGGSSTASGRGAPGAIQPPPPPPPASEDDDEEP
jgi:hypothetical protein